MAPRRRYLVLLASILGMLPAALDQTVVDTAMPRMIAELGGLTLWGWVITVYLLASTAFVPVVGRLLDVYGRKWFFCGAVSCSWRPRPSAARPARCPR